MPDISPTFDVSTLDDRIQSTDDLAYLGQRIVETAGLIGGMRDAYLRREAVRFETAAQERRWRRQVDQAVDRFRGRAAAPDATQRTTRRLICAQPRSSTGSWG